MKKSILFPAAAVVLGLVFFTRNRADARPDAVSSSSIDVSATSITATSATINYFNDVERSGTRTLCYDPAPAQPVDNCVSHKASGHSGSFNITGLKPATKYNYNVEATKSGENSYGTSGNFSTATGGSTAVISVDLGRPDPASAPAFDLRGRALPKGAAPRGIITVTRQVR